MRLYLDASAIIYAIEGASAVKQASLDQLRAVQSSPTGIALTSVLSKLECRTKPLAQNNSSLLLEYDRFFLSPSLQTLDILPQTVEQATILRARYRLKSMDALHIATALEAQCDIFLTGDVALARCQELKIILLRPSDR